MPKQIYFRHKHFFYSRHFMGDQFQEAENLENNQFKIIHIQILIGKSSCILPARVGVIWFKVILMFWPKIKISFTFPSSSKPKGSSPAPVSQGLPTTATAPTHSLTYHSVFTSLFVGGIWDLTFFPACSKTHMQKFWLQFASVVYWENSLSYFSLLFYLNKKFKLEPKLFRNLCMGEA